MKLVRRETEGSGVLETTPFELVVYHVYVPLYDTRGGSSESPEGCDYSPYSSQEEISWAVYSVVI